MTEIIEAAKTVTLPGALVLVALILGACYVIGQFLKIFR